MTKTRTPSPVWSQFHQHFMAIFLHESALCIFFLGMFWLCNFLAQNIGAKVSHKMLMKLTPTGKVDLIFADKPKQELPDGKNKSKPKPRLFRFYQLRFQCRLSISSSN